METVGQIISEAISMHELNPCTIERQLDFPKGIISKLMKDDFYTVSVPIVLFKDLILSLHIPFDKIESAMLPTFRLMVSKETPASIKNKPHGYMLWENEESLNKYTTRLKELLKS